MKRVILASLLMVTACSVFSTSFVLVGAKNNHIAQNLEGTWVPDESDRPTMVDEAVFDSVTFTRNEEAFAPFLNCSVEGDYDCLEYANDSDDDTDLPTEFYVYFAGTMTLSINGEAKDYPVALTSLNGVSTLFFVKDKDATTPDWESFLVWIKTGLSERNHLLELGGDDAEYPMRTFKKVP